MTPLHNPPSYFHPQVYKWSLRIGTREFYRETTEGDTETALSELNRISIVPQCYIHATKFTASGFALGKRKGNGLSPVWSVTTGGKRVRTGVLCQRFNPAATASSAKQHVASCFQRTGSTGPSRARPAAATALSNRELV